MKDLIYKLISAGIEKSEAKQEIAILQKEFSDQNKIKKIINERIKTRTPIQYLLGKAYFMDFVVKVTDKVLIPRPETEILVEETIKRCRDMPWHIPTVIDIGTGSGVIAIALAKLISSIKIIAIDVSKEIIGLAYENAKANCVEKKIDFKVCDLFSEYTYDIFRGNDFNLIISNPPYIKEGEFQKLEPEIYLHEPKTAHCGTKENVTGMVYYERVIELVKKNSKPQAQGSKLLALEIDPTLVKNLKTLLVKQGLNNFEIIKDYAKLNRCLFVYLNS